jgi:hypothetical protein
MDIKKKISFRQAIVILTVVVLLIFPLLLL